MKTKTISVRVHISLEDIENLLYSGASGSSYWCDNAYELGYESVIKKILSPLNTTPIELIDSEGHNKRFTINLKKIKKGITILAKKYFHHINDIVEGNADSYTADALIQCAIFGDIIYS